MKYNFLCNKYIQCMFHITKPSYWTFILHIIYIHMLFFGCNPCAILSDRLWSFEFWDIDWDRFGSKKRFFFFCNLKSQSTNLKIFTPWKLLGLGIAGSLKGKPASSMGKGCKNCNSQSPYLSWGEKLQCTLCTKYS